MSQIPNQRRSRVLTASWSVWALLLALSCGDDPASGKGDSQPSGEEGSPSAGNGQGAPPASAGAAAVAVAAAGSEYFDDPWANDAGSGDESGLAAAGQPSTGGAPTGAGEASGGTGGAVGAGGTFHTGGRTATASTGGTTASGSCSAMVDKKARLCGLDETGVQLANMGYCEICSDAGEARFTACMAGVTTCADAETCRCSE